MDKMRRKAKVRMQGASRDRKNKSPLVYGEDRIIQMRKEMLLLASVPLGHKPNNSVIKVLFLHSAQSKKHF